MFKLYWTGSHRTHMWRESRRMSSGQIQLTNKAVFNDLSLFSRSPSLSQSLPFECCLSAILQCHPWLMQLWKAFSSTKHCGRRVSFILSLSLPFCFLPNVTCFSPWVWKWFGLICMLMPLGEVKWCVHITWLIQADSTALGQNYLHLRLSKSQIH